MPADHAAGGKHSFAAAEVRVNCQYASVGGHWERRAVAEKLTSEVTFFLKKPHIRFVKREIEIAFRPVCAARARYRRGGR